MFLKGQAKKIRIASQGQKFSQIFFWHFLLQRQIIALYLQTLSRSLLITPKYLKLFDKNDERKNC
jgi:hypothetical protein